MTNKIICEVFRSPRREGMYLYVERAAGLENVPEALLASFGEPESALVFALDPARKLARANTADVLAALVDPGFYLQMPPVPGARTTPAAPGASADGDAPSEADAC